MESFASIAISHFFFHPIFLTFVSSRFKNFVETFVYFVVVVMTTLIVAICVLTMQTECFVRHNKDERSCLSLREFIPLTQPKRRLFVVRVCYVPVCLFICLH